MIPKIPKHLDSLTEFYRRKALVIGDHPHAGKTVQCLGAFKWAKHWYMVFQDLKSGLKFTVDSPSNITWIEEKKKDEDTAQSR